MSNTDLVTFALIFFKFKSDNKGKPLQGFFGFYVHIHYTNKGTLRRNRPDGVPVLW